MAYPAKVPVRFFKQGEYAKINGKLYVLERTCDWEWVHSGPFFDIFKCRKCLYEFYEPRCVQGYSDLVANYCPNCGAKVVEE